MKLGEKIKEIRKSKNISQEALAGMLKVNRNYLSRIETGKSEPTSSILKHIAEIFKLDLNSLLDINTDALQNNEKIKYIAESCKNLHDKDLDFLVRIISVMKEEYVKINTNIEWYLSFFFYILNYETKQRTIIKTSKYRYYLFLSFNCPKHNILLHNKWKEKKYLKYTLCR